MGTCLSDAPSARNCDGDRRMYSGRNSYRTRWNCDGDHRMYSGTWVGLPTGQGGRVSVDTVVAQKWKFPLESLALPI